MTGTLLKLDVGMGAWVLEADDGKRYELVGDIPAGLEGKRVDVEGRRAKKLMGFAMAGPTLEVRRIRRA